MPAYDKDIDDERLTNAAVGITGVLSGVLGSLAISYLYLTCFILLFSDIEIYKHLPNPLLRVEFYKRLHLPIIQYFITKIKERSHEGIFGILMTAKTVAGLVEDFGTDLVSEKEKVVVFFLLLQFFLDLQIHLNEPAFQGVGNELKELIMELQEDVVQRLKNGFLNICGKYSKK